MLQDPDPAFLEDVPSEIVVAGDALSHGKEPPGAAGHPSFAAGLGLEERAIPGSLGERGDRQNAKFLGHEAVQRGLRGTGIYEKQG